MSIKKIVIYLVILAVVVVAVRTWLDKPYCTVTFMDAQTVRGKDNLIFYAISKLITQRKQLMGSDPYKMYIYINDPDGIRSFRFTVDGKDVNLNMDKNAFTFEHELSGDTEIGLHEYKLDVTDNKGNTAEAISLVKVSPMPAAVPLI